MKKAVASLTVFHLIAGTSYSSLEEIPTIDNPEGEFTHFAVDRDGKIVYAWSCPKQYYHGTILGEHRDSLFVADLVATGIKSDDVKIVKRKGLIFLTRQLDVPSGHHTPTMLAELLDTFYILRHSEGEKLSESRRAGIEAWAQKRLAQWLYANEWAYVAADPSRQELIGSANCHFQAMGCATAKTVDGTGLLIINAQTRPNFQAEILVGARCLKAVTVLYKGIESQEPVSLIPELMPTHSTPCLPPFQNLSRITIPKQRYLVSLGAIKFRELKRESESSEDSDINGN
ncbi:MAG: hypothetical protein LIP02_09480 [Bacteroidales bacterium]|nr:hypothetical protein [Bacteroidales bacterium]